MTDKLTETNLFDFIIKTMGIAQKNDLDNNKFMSISEKIDYIAKDQNLNHLIQDIVSICPSMNQK